MTKGAKLELRTEPELLKFFKNAAEARGMKFAPWVRLACINLIAHSNDTGTSTRDSITIVAMHALWTHPPINVTVQQPDKLFEELADLAYKFADAVIAVRDKQEKS